MNPHLILIKIKKCVRVRVEIEHEPPAWNTYTGFLLSLALTVQIRVLSLKARCCHVFHIQKRFIRNRSVEQHFVTGHFRLILVKETTSKIFGVSFRIPVYVIPFLYVHYRIFTCISRTFWQEFTLQNWGAAYTRNIMSFWLSPQCRYCMLWNSQ
jgi:hypothetical protein